MTESSQLLEIQRVFGLPVQLARVLHLLLTSERVRQPDLMDLVSTFHSDRPYHNAGRMAVSRLRSRMKEHGIVVHCQYGEGYYLSPADKSFIRGQVQTPRR